MTVLTTDLLERPSDALATQLNEAVGQASGTDPIRLDQPFNLYLVDRQANEYLGLMSFGPYKDSFHSAVRELIADNATELLAGLPAPVDLVDLGPGYPDKTFPLLSRARADSRKCRYIPVDINARFLAIAGEACEPFGFPIEPVQCLFEELPAMLSRRREGASRLFLMGVTFMNYEPAAGAALISRLMRPGDKCMVATALRTDRSDQNLAAPYQSERARNFNQLPLELAGVDTRGLAYFARFRNERVEMGFTLTHPTIVAARLLPAGAEIMTSISYRYTEEQLAKVLCGTFGTVRIASDRSKSRAIAIVQDSLPPRSS